jgi:hypothetical protein
MKVIPGLLVILLAGCVMPSGDPENEPSQEQTPTTTTAPRQLGEWINTSHGHVRVAEVGDLPDGRWNWSMEFVPVEGAQPINFGVRYWQGVHGKYEIDGPRTFFVETFRPPPGSVLHMTSSAGKPYSQWEYAWTA